MTQLAAADNAVPNTEQSRGHFTTALHVDGSSGAMISRNDIVMTGTHVDAVSPERAVARLTNVQGLTLRGNRFAVEGHAATAALPLVIEAPQDALITGNMLERTPLQFVPDAAAKHPTKRTSVTGNSLIGAVVNVAQAVTGDTTVSTTINDLRFIENRFWNVDASQCLIDAPYPLQPGRTFGEKGNVRDPGGKPAKTCNLRELAPTMGIKPPAPRPEKATVVVIPPTVQPVKPVLPPRPRTVDNTTAATPPAVPERKPHWLKRFLKRIEAKVRDVF